MRSGASSSRICASCVCTPASRCLDALSFSFSSAVASISSCSWRRSSWSIASGCESSCTRRDAHASSTRSIALSGRKRCRADAAVSRARAGRGRGGAAAHLRDVAVGQLRRGHEGGVGDAHAVMGLVALLEAAQDGDGVGHGRLAHLHLLESALKRRVLLDVLAVLGQRGCALRRGKRETAGNGR